MTKTRPLAVLISDVHYSLQTLSLADEAMRMAIDKSNKLCVPLIVAGDLHDTKANLRGECVNAMIKTFKLADNRPYLIIGNHDLINEKSSEHSLRFLERYTNIVHGFRTGASHTNIGNELVLVAYQSDVNILKKYLKACSRGHYRQIILHQGIQGSNSGEYYQDKSAINLEDASGLRIISGHYHARQTIELPNHGKWDYIGNPYTLNFGEAADPEKGFQILMQDGTLEFVPTKLRKHVIIEIEQGVRHYSSHPEIGDLVWIKAKGPKDWLSTLTKDKIRKDIGLEIDFKLELIPADTKVKATKKTNSMAELLDELIEQHDKENATALKQLWRSLCE